MKTEIHRHPSLDVQQQSCMSNDRNLLIHASAGSGKTTVIVERFLHLVQLGTSPERLLLLTFTNKAAKEMSERVFSRLFAEPYVTLPHVRTAIEEGRIFSIQTIDAFCANLARNYAHRMDIQHYTSLSSHQFDISITRICRTYLAQNQQNPILMRFLHAMNHRNSEKKLLNALLVPIAKRMRPLKSETWLTRLDTIISFLETERSTLKKTITASVKEITTEEPSSPKSLEFITQCKELISDHSEDTFFQLCQLLWNENLRSHSKSPEIKKQVQFLRGEKKSPRSLLSNYTLLYRYHKNPEELRDVCTMLDDFERYIRKAKKREDIYGFSDTFSLVLTLLNRYPDILATIHSLFDHIMVDEFQDNNSEQFDFIQLLCGNPRPQKQGTPEPMRTLCCVGDEKQSIYGFRGADLQAYDILCATMLERGGEKIELYNNYRSISFLVSFFNDVFPRIFPTLAEAPSQISTKNDPLPKGITYTKVQAVRDRGPLHNKIHIAIAPYSSEAHMHEARWVASHISLLFQDHIHIVHDAGDRPIRYSDIAILFRKRTHSLQFERALNQAHIPFINPFTKGIEEEEFYHFFSAFLELFSFQDPLSIAYLTILKSPLIMISDETIANILAQHNPVFSTNAKSIIKNPEESALYVQACAHWEHLILHTSSPLYILDYIWYRWGFFWYASDSAPQLIHHYQYLRELVQESNITSAAAFHVFLQEQREQGISTQPGANMSTKDIDAVQLLSIHAAKGLEFPVVFIADAQAHSRITSSPQLFAPHACGLIPSMPCLISEDSEFQNIPTQNTYIHPQDARAHQELEDAETKRLLYVALTRAMQMVFISGTFPKYNTHHSTLLSLLCDALDLPIDQVFTKESPTNTVLSSPRCPDVCIYSIPEEKQNPTANNAQPSIPEVSSTPPKEQPISPNILYRSIFSEIPETSFLPTIPSTIIRFSVTQLALVDTTNKHPLKHTNAHSPSRDSAKLFGTCVHTLINQGIHDAVLRSSIRQFPQSREKTLSLITSILQSYNPLLYQNPDNPKPILDKIIEHAQTFFNSVCWRNYSEHVLATEESFLFGFPPEDPRHTIEGVIDLLIDPTSTSNQSLPLCAIKTPEQSSASPLILVDYKTDAIRNSMHHLFQLETYAYVIETLFNRPCDMYLFYTRPNSISSPFVHVEKHTKDLPAEIAKRISRYESLGS